LLSSRTRWLPGVEELKNVFQLVCDQHRAAGLAAVACDPLRESAHRRLALIHISEGNLAEALRQYHVYQQMARSGPGLPPSPQFRKLMSPLLGLPTDL
jgi:DNA-binding SARP family transcriptional activator